MSHTAQAFRCSILGLCLVAVVLVLVGCGAALDTTLTTAPNNTLALTDEVPRLTIADEGSVECLDWVGGLVPVENAVPGTFVNKWSSPDSAIALDNQGNVYVAGHHLTSEGTNVEFFEGIKKYDPNGALLAKWSSKGSGDGKWRMANDMVVDHNGNIFVADQDMSGIQKLDAHGKFVTKWGSHGLGHGQFWGSPGSLAVDAEGNVYATSSSRIQKFDNDGKFLSEWRFNYDPHGIAIDPLGNMFTTSMTKNRVYKHDANGKQLAAWGRQGHTDSLFGYNSPSDLTVDALGNVYVFDNRNYRIQKFDNNGRLLAKWGSVGRGNGQFGSGDHGGFDSGMMGGLAVDMVGVIYVLDSRNHRVQKFCAGV